jgi:hypothetical protein
MHAEVPFALENHHFAPAARQRPGHGEADDTRADHDAIDIIQRSYPAGLIAAAAAMNSSTSALGVA